VEAAPDWKLDGVNLLPFLNGEKAEAPHEALYWRFGQQIALRMGDWKLVKAPGGGTEPGENAGKATTERAQLYNLKNDIGEKDNLADKNPEKLKELAATWEKWNATLIDPKWGPTPGGNGGKAAKRKKKA
jgi:arylsulfatase A-like enzyme